MAQRKDKQHQADPIAEEAYEGGTEQRRGERQRCAMPQGKRQVDGSGDEALEYGDLHRVGGA